MKRLLLETSLPGGPWPVGYSFEIHFCFDHWLQTFSLSTSPWLSHFPWRCPARPISTFCTGGTQRETEGHLTGPHQMLQQEKRNCWAAAEVRLFVPTTQLQTTISSVTRVTIITNAHHYYHSQSAIVRLFQFCPAPQFFRLGPTSQQEVSWGPVIQSPPPNPI